MPISNLNQGMVERALILRRIANNARRLYLENNVKRMEDAREEIQAAIRRERTAGRPGRRNILSLNIIKEEVSSARKKLDSLISAKSYTKSDMYDLKASIKRIKGHLKHIKSKT